MLNFFNTRPLAALLQPRTTSLKAISLPLLLSFSSSCSKFTDASGRLEFVLVKLILTKANDLRELNYYLRQRTQRMNLGGSGFLLLCSKGYYCGITRTEAAKQGPLYMVSISWTFCRRFLSW
jgi:hypothetical protein